MTTERSMVVAYRIIERIKPNVYVHIAIQKMLEDAIKNIADIERFPRPKNEFGFDVKLIIALDELSKWRYGECPICERNGVADKRLWFIDEDIWVCESCKQMIEKIRKASKVKEATEEDFKKEFPLPKSKKEQK